MTFDNETAFEKALIHLLTEHYGWEKEILEYKTEEDLIKNWKEILFQNNRDIDRLNDTPLTDSEMAQVLEQVQKWKTPYNLNKFINGKTISIKRDNAEDSAHLGKEVSLKIYNRQEIQGGQSRYQIARQPVFKPKKDIYPKRRGDFMLLINGMPVIHVELKKSGIPISQAANQIEKYAHEGVFTGLFSLVQILVAMNPEDAVYFANPGPEGKFNPNFYFHWADNENIKVNDWQKIAEMLLSIPMAHQMIGFYTVADAKDESLKVLRSYQYWAANSISERVRKADWQNKNNKYGGYIWHTTGSGKTLTSFKAAQLIADSGNADKVIFLVDRVELGTQTLGEYQNFADDAADIQETTSSYSLLNKLKSNDKTVNLIVTSIQKMNILCKGTNYVKETDIEKINEKRIVFVIDEAHRSTFGEMLQNIKNTFTQAIFFGFTGTPIFDENQKKMNTTADVFGKELHRYSIADGINDKNVLGFDTDMVQTYKDKDLRKAIALEKVHAKTEEEAIKDPVKRKKYYYYYMNECPMTGYHDSKTGFDVKGIEDYLRESVHKAQFEREEHQTAVVSNIIENFSHISRGKKFHAIFAVSSIKEAIEYYRLFKKIKPDLKVTALFDPNLTSSKQEDVEDCETSDETDDKYFIFKEDALYEILEDYNTRFKRKYTIETHDRFKIDISLRLAHKPPYSLIEKKPEEELDILIVVDQMLTGYDSKWINTLYLDKELRYEKIIQAFSRTNRIFGNEKPFGVIKYYRFVHTMKRNIERAVKLYSGDKPYQLFAEKLEENLKKINTLFADIKTLFTLAGIPHFERLPDDIEVKRKFARLFKELNDHLEAAKVQGFVWKKLEYEFGEGKEKHTLKLSFDEITYNTLLTRYKELFSSQGGDSSYVPYDIDTYITEIDTAVIDADYMNANFKKYLSIRESGRKEDVDAILNEIHRSFASLPQDKQKTAHGIMLEIQSGKLKIEEGKTLNDYITERMTRTKNDIIRAFAESFRLNENLLRELIEQKVTETTINSFGRFDNLLKTVDKQKAKEFIENAENRTIPAHRLSMKISAYVQKFILNGGVDVIYSAAAEEKLLPDSITAADLSLFYRGAPNLTAAADEEKKYEK